MSNFTKCMLTLALLVAGVGGAKSQVKLSIAAGWNTSLEDLPILTGNEVFNYKNAYASVNLISSTINTSAYKGFKLELADDAPVDRLQINFGSDKGSGNIEDYTGPINSISYVGNFPEGANTVSKISLQACNVADLGRVEIKSFYLIDSNDQMVSTEYERPASWAADVLSVYNATVSYINPIQYTFFSVKGAEGFNNKMFIAKSSENFPENIQFCVNTSKAGDSRYIGCPTDKNVFSFNIELADEGQTITEMVVQNTKENAGENVAGRDQFKVKNVQVTMYDLAESAITVGSERFITYNYPIPVSATGVTAYAAKYEGGSIVLTPVDNIPANTAVIIEADAGQYNLPTIASADALGSINQLQISDGTVTGASGDIYALKNGTHGVGFYLVNAGVTIPDGKAYLQIPSTGRTFLGFGDKSTGIRNVKVETIDNAIYNVAGQRVMKTQKGLFILNGKKILVK